MADSTGDGSINTNFAHAKPESNVGPAGAAQTSLGSAGQPAVGGSVVHGDPRPPEGDTVAGSTVPDERPRDSAEKGEFVDDTDDRAL